MATENRARNVVRRLVRAIPLALLLGPAACSWNRTVVNEHLLGLDVDAVQPGQTTLPEVLMRFGLPPEDNPEEIGVRVLSGDHLDYATLDTRCTVFGLVTFFVVAPFRWCAAVRSYQVSLEFDRQGVVERVVTTRREGFWPPFWNQEDVPRPVTTIRTVEGRR